MLIWPLFLPIQRIIIENMKKINYLIVALLSFSLQMFAEHSTKSNGAYAIDQSDTITFDIENAGYANSKMYIPISIQSDDSIFALDFSLKFNELRLQFDTIYDPSGMIQPFVYYNQVDSTLRLTSSSFTTFPLHTTVFILVFDVLSLPVLPADIYQIMGYLNGDPCSVEKAAVLFTSISTNLVETVSVFPNPAHYTLTINNPEQTDLIIFSYTMQVVQPIITLSPGSNQVNVDKLIPGYYFFKLVSANTALTVKILITQ